MGRTRWRLLAAAGALLLLTGCVPEDEPVPTPSESSPEPTYSDEELLEQAMSSYTGYLRESQLMVEDQNLDYTRLLEFATPEIATNDVALMQEIADLGWTQEGENQLSAFALSSSPTADPLSVDVVACVDVSTIVYVDMNGADVTPEGSPDQVPLDLTFTRTDTAGEFLLTTQTAWDSEGPDPCTL